MRHTVYVIAVLLWIFSLCMLVAVVIDGLFQLSTRDVVREAGDQPPWEVFQPSIFGEWTGIMRAYVDVDDVEGAIVVIRNEAPAEEKDNAAQQLVDVLLTTHHFAPAPVSTPTSDVTSEEYADQLQKQIEKERAERNKFVLDGCRKVHNYVDSLKPSETRLNVYSRLAVAYHEMEADRDSRETFKQLANDISVVRVQPSPYDRIVDWFRPLFRENIALLACGLMVFVVVLFRPTIQVWSKAISIRLHSRNPNKYIQRALGNEPVEHPKVLLP